MKCREDDAKDPDMARRDRPRADRHLRRGRARHAGRARRVVPHADRRARDSRTGRRAASARLIVKPDGSELIATERRGTAADAEALAATPAMSSGAAAARAPLDLIGCRH